MDDPLIWVRALHFAATLSVSGAVFFQTFVAVPAFGAVEDSDGIAAGVGLRLARIAWLSLALALFSGAAWLVLQAARMSERSLGAMWSEDIVATVLFETDFGNVWLARGAVAGLLAAALFPSFFTRGRTLPWRCGVALACAAALAGTLALVGHAAAGSGTVGIVHEMADILHLLAAATWGGALVPLAMLLGAAASVQSTAAGAIARVATLRFSTLGIVSVATVLGSGVVNSWVLAGSVSALVGTDYGRLLLVKVALFLVMVVVAAVNRLRLTPRLIQDKDDLARQDALRQLRNNSMIEAGIGAVILMIVGVLGTLPPSLQE